MKRFVPFVALLISMGDVAAARPSNSAIMAFNQGVKLFNAQNWEQAIPYFDQAIDKDAEFSDAYFARAICQQALKNIDNALSDVNQAIRLKPEYIDAYSLRGALYYQMEEWYSALHDFNAVLKVRPRDAQAILGRGLLMLKRNQLEQAASDFHLFLELKPNDPLAPRLRKVLASIDSDIQQESPRSAQSETASNDPSRSSRRRMSATSQELSEALFQASTQRSTTYNQKVMRGERAEAIGDSPSRANR